MIRVAAEFAEVIFCAPLNIEQGRTKVAEVSKKWFRVADTYGVEVAEGQDPVGPASPPFFSPPS